VKKILGTAEDYRRLYGPDAGAPSVDTADAWAVPEVASAPKLSTSPAKKAQAPAKKKPKAPAKRKPRKR
jgi:hypothetical protein